MAIRRQNRTIWILAAAVFLVLVTYLVRDQRFKNLTNSPSQDSSESSATDALQDAFGDKVNGMASSFQGDQKKKFAETLEKLNQCFQLQVVEVPETVPANETEALMQKLQSAFGPAAHQEDHWMTWHLRTRDGKERRLRLEITESDEGKVGRELHYFSVDRDGQPSPLELDAEKASNPTDEVISQMLKEGEVIYKERAGVVFFANNERIEFVEKDGDLAEIDIFKDEHEFRCENVHTADTCQCR